MLRGSLFKIRFSLQRARLSCFTWIVIVLFVFSVTVSADDSQEELSRLHKQAEKLKRKGEFKEAEKLLRHLLEKNPQDSEVKLKLAYVLMKQRKLVDAYELAFPVAKAEPKNSFAFAVLGMIFLGAGNFNDANTCLVNALLLNKKEDLAWAGLGLLDFYENRIEDSIIRLENAHYLKPREPDYVFSLAQVYARAERYREAADFYQKFLDMAPPSDAERRDRIKGLMDFLRYVSGKNKLYTLSGEKKTVVPIKILKDRPVIQVYIGKEKEPLNFVLDTGSGISVLNEQTAQRLKIKPIARGGKARGVGGEGKFDIVYGFLSSIRIGEIKIENVPVYIRRFHGNQEAIDGYIGLALISKFLATVDYGSLQFSLVRRDDDEKAIASDSANSFPLRLTLSGYLSGEVYIEGIEAPLNFIVDTGASISVISEDLAALEQVKQHIAPERLRVIGAAGVTENVPTYVLPKIRFANQTRENIRTIALDLDLINETSGFHQAGILGGNFLKHYRLTFDFVAAKVYLEPIDSSTSAKR